MIPVIINDTNENNSEYEGVGELDEDLVNADGYAQLIE